MSLTFRRSWLNAMCVIDFYKLGHRSMYPANTEYVFSNWTARSTKHFPAVDGFFDGKHVVMGVQGFVTEFLDHLFKDTFFDQPKEVAVDSLIEDIEMATATKVDPKWVQDLWELDYLPIEVRALPEGVLAPANIPEALFTNTKKGYGWLVNYIETLWSNGNWRASTVATIALQYRRILTKYALDTGTPLEFVDWQGHDFSYRGLSDPYAAASQIGHAAVFRGSDTFPVIQYVNAYYRPEGKKKFVIGSIQASEHSVMCMGTKGGEKETVKRLLTEVVPEGGLSIVGDTWNIFDFNDMLIELKDEILARPADATGLSKVVSRPDSGNPADIICGWPYVTIHQPQWTLDEKITLCLSQGFEYFLSVEDDGTRQMFKVVKMNEEITVYPVDERVVFGSVEQLWRGFGGTRTSKGYKQLDSHIGVIYGDSITPERAVEIMERLKAKGFASGNVVLGIGSYTYQYITRDTLGYAIKATAGIVDGELREVQKDPVTDDGTKKSATGLLAVDWGANNTLVLRQKVKLEEYGGNAMHTVFKDGKVTKVEDWETIRERLFRHAGLI